jgi:hypothetical protein
MPMSRLLGCGERILCQHSCSVCPRNLGWFYLECCVFNAFYKFTALQFVVPRIHHAVILLMSCIWISFYKIALCSDFHAVIIAFNTVSVSSEELPFPVVFDLFEALALSSRCNYCFCCFWKQVNLLCMVRS